MKKILAIVAVWTPMMAFAANPLYNFITKLQQAVNLLIPLFMVLAVAVFLWGIVRYITASGDAEKEKAARGYIIYGLIGMFVLVALWGILALVGQMIGTTPGGTTVIPGFQFQ